MRIGIYKDTLANRRGADAAVLALAEGLRERGHDVVVFGKKDFERRIQEPWDVMISTGTNELLDLYAWFMANPSPTHPLTHSSTHPLSHFPWPVIQQFHTNPKSQFKRKRFVRNWRIRRALRHVSAIQVLSEEFVPQVAKYGVPVHVIGNWSRYEHIKLTTNHQPLTANRQPLTANTIIYPAVFAKGKNQKLLIEAFALVAGEFPGWRLRLLGRAEGRYAEKCRKLAEDMGNGERGMGNGRIEFAGFCEDMASEYERCAFVAFPSVDEGFALALVEAAHFEKPVVLVKDWIGTCDVGGGLVTKATATAYSRGLRMLMSDPGLREQMGKSAREFIDASYSKASILDKWAGLLAQTAKGATSTAGTEGVAR